MLINQAVGRMEQLSDFYAWWLDRGSGSDVRSFAYNEAASKYATDLTSIKQLLIMNQSYLRPNDAGEMA